MNRVARNTNTGKSERVARVAASEQELGEQEHRHAPSSRHLLMFARVVHDTNTGKGESVARIAALEQEPGEREHRDAPSSRHSTSSDTGRPPG